jgi:hypothetical protein
MLVGAWLNRAVSREGIRVEAGRIADRVADGEAAGIQAVAEKGVILGEGVVANPKKRLPSPPGKIAPASAWRTQDLAEPPACLNGPLETMPIRTARFR